MAIKFLSPEYEEKLRELLKEDFSKPSSLTTTFCQIILGCPDGKDRWVLYGVEKGIMSDFKIGEGEPPEANYRVRGPYQVYVDLIQGKYDGKTSLITGKLKLEGNMTRALGLLGAYTRIEKNQKSIDTDFAL